jgi:hypothetical protein
MISCATVDVSCRIPPYVGGDGWGADAAFNRCPCSERIRKRVFIVAHDTGKSHDQLYSTTKTVTTIINLFPRRLNTNSQLAGIHTRKGRVHCLSTSRGALLKRTSESNFNLNTYLDSANSGALTAYSRASKPMAYVPTIARGKISLALSIHCGPNFFKFILPDHRLYIVRNMCIYTHPTA